MDKTMSRDILQASTLILSAILGLSTTSSASNRSPFLIQESETQTAETDSSTLREDIGYRLTDAGISSSFQVSNEIRAFFAKNNDLRSHMPAVLPAGFQAITSGLQDFIKSNAARGAEQRNGISHNELAAKIVRASFCFGTDPLMAAGTMVVESHFDNKQVSNTGAVGLTQMTSSGLDEVNDQLGNSNGGKSRANSTTAPILRKFIACYLADGSDAQNGSHKVWRNMWEDGVFPVGTVLVEKRKYMAVAKRWVVSDLDRSLIYGQILLKTYLATQNPTGLKKSWLNPQRAEENLYTQALRAYNGEPGKRKNVYATKVDHFYNQMVDM
jgi:hypothetical protein